MHPELNLAAVVIGRNEGARLIRCLDALKGQVSPIIYVDSGSTDGSVVAAEAAGATVVALDMALPFTAARARNAGLARLEALGEAPECVQVIDGDCELRAGWVDAALAFLAAHKDVAMVAGRLRERFPEASLWNRLADREWDTPVGETRAVGGIAVLRLAPVQELGGYRADLIAGEEPELCLRLRRAGWRIWRLEAEMAWHDIAMTQFAQWWRRARRYGHALAEGVALHGTGPERYCVAERRRALLWGLALPLVTLLGALITPWALALLLIWPLQVMRLRKRGESGAAALFLTLGKLPEAQGVLGYYLTRRKAPQIIEYK